MRQIRDAAIYALLIGIGVVVLSPFAWMVSTALKTSGAEFTYPPELIPRPFVWGNFSRALTAVPFHLFFRNTLTIALSNVVGTLVVCSMSAYAFARVHFFGRSLWFRIVLATMMMPWVVYLVPRYLMVTKLGWVDTFLPLIIPPVLAGGAFSIFILRQFFAGIPIDLDEAARMDGAGHLRILVQIILPLSVPALASVSVLNFMAHWNEFLTPLLYLNTTEKKTLALGLRMFQQEYTTEWNLMMAASTVVVLPVLLVFLLTQRYFVKGIALTGISGR